MSVSKFRANAGIYRLVPRPTIFGVYVGSSSSVPLVSETIGVSSERLESDSDSVESDDPGRSGPLFSANSPPSGAVGDDEFAHECDFGALPFVTGFAASLAT